MPAKMKRAATRACALVVAALSTMKATPALADESPGELLFREGRAQMLEGRFDEACPKIAESQRLEPHVGTLLNLAACHERQDKVGSAWVEYQKALTAARAEGQGDRARLAQDRIGVLEARVPWLLVIVPPGGDVIVSLDGGTVQSVAYGKEMPVDPGTHVVTATTAGRPSFEQTIELHEGEHAVVNVAVASREPLPAETAPARVVVDPTPHDAAPAAAPQKERSRWVFEAGVFIGYMNASTDRPEATTEIPLQSSVAGGGSSSCTAQQCSYRLPAVHGAAAGPNVMIGYSLSDTFVAGLRVLAGPRVTRGGGSIIAVGPSISVRASSAWSFGVWALLGSASVGSSNGDVSPPQGYQTTYSGPFNLDGSTALGAGLGFEASLHLVDLAGGSLVLNSTPFFLEGSTGGAWTLPIGLAYRFQ
jgi:hypothetical protein